MSSVIAASQIGETTSLMMRTHHQPIGDLTGRWWLLHTKARNEKALAIQLCDFGLDYFLPLIRVPRCYGRRRVEAVMPLFPGYLFVACVTDEDRYRVLYTKRVANVIAVTEQQRLILELEQIRRALLTTKRAELYPGIKKGRRCRVTGGSLKGLEGVVSGRRATGRIFLDVTMLGQSAVVDIDVTLLEPID
ncbi:MAG: transcription termination/antitermination protein NusG [Dehalococcoidia bacterium]